MDVLNWVAANLNYGLVTAMLVVFGAAAYIMRRDDKRYGDKLRSRYGDLPE